MSKLAIFLCAVIVVSADGAQIWSSSFSYSDVLPLINVTIHLNQQSNVLFDKLSADTRKESTSYHAKIPVRVNEIITKAETKIENIREYSTVTGCQEREKALNLKKDAISVQSTVRVCMDEVQNDTLKNIQSNETEYNRHKSDQCFFKSGSSLCNSQASTLLNRIQQTVRDLYVRFEACLGSKEVVNLTVKSWDLIDAVKRCVRKELEARRQTTTTTAP